MEILGFKHLLVLVCSLLGEDRKGSSMSGWDEGNGSVLHLHSLIIQVYILQVRWQRLGNDPPWHTELKQKIG